MIATLLFALQTASQPLSAGLPLLVVCENRHERVGRSDNRLSQRNSFIVGPGLGEQSVDVAVRMDDGRSWVRQRQLFVTRNDGGGFAARFDATNAPAVLTSLGRGRARLRYQESYLLTDGAGTMAVTGTCTATTQRARRRAPRS
jgi:hypothetical protein